MSNMNYCRFENILAGLQDCYNALDDGALDDKEMLEYEVEGRDNLIKLCTNISRDYDNDM